MATVRSDLDVRQDVVRALAFDVRVGLTNVDVEVLGGVVYLRGSVSSYVEKRSAAETASDVKGVLDVIDELRLAYPVQRDDSDLADAVRAALGCDARVDATGVKVDVRGGQVRLTGTVDTYVEREHAEEDAWLVPGVIEVIDDLSLRPARPRSDQEVAAELRSDLDRDARLATAKITTDVQSGTVYLRGSVPGVRQRWLAKGRAWRIPGVRDVVDELQVDPWDYLNPPA